jgi:hypothetical protein
MTRGRPRTHATIEVHQFNHAAFQIANAWTPDGPKRVWIELMRWFNAQLHHDSKAAARVITDATSQIARTPR